MTGALEHKTLAWYPIAAVGATGAAFSVIKTGRDAVFFAETGLAQLPWANLWAEIGLAFAAYVHLSAMRRFGTRRTRTGAFLVIGAMFVAVVPFIGERGLVVRALYPLVPVVFAALFSSAWLLAADLLDGADARLVQKTYSYIGAGAMVGGIVGGLAAKGLAAVLAAPYLIGAGGVLLFATGWLCANAHGRRVPAQPEPAAQAEPDAPVPSSTFALLAHPYTRVLLVISSLTALAAMYVEFQFYAAAFLAGRAGPQFFADYYVFLCVASLVFQLVVTPWIQARWGVARALLVLPLGVLGGAGLVALTATVATQSGFRLLETGLKNSIHRSSWEQVFLRFDREQRAAMKVMIDGTIPRLAGVIGAIALYFIVVHDRELTALDGVGRWLAWVLIPLAAVWIPTTRSLGRAETPAPAPAALALEPEIRLPDS